MDWRGKPRCRANAALVLRSNRRMAEAMVGFMARVNYRFPGKVNHELRHLGTIGYMIGDRIKELRTGAEMTQEQFAVIAGTTKQYVGRLEKGINKDPNPKMIEAWARRFRVRMEWITTGNGPKVDSADPLAKESDWQDVIGYGQAAGLGSGAEAEEYAETHSLKFKATSLRRQGLQARNLAIYYGKGDSMEPTIKDGDAILFDTSDTRVVDGGLYLIQLHGAANAEYYVKRAEVLDGTVYFRSDNPAGDHNWKKPKRMDSAKAPITVVGRVRWIAGWVD
ncbi:XRE family transcriptional regulator [Pseudoxanthomonas winnipegensis]|uniref:XRE family transcriptional regulator n=1 Tax=Pseudoxanthomonas winnipegensis TaxID=2480810 RepID=UPI002E257F44